MMCESGSPRRERESPPLAFLSHCRDMLGVMARNGASVAGRGRIVAVLGPTNTGKTHLAMERMLGHASGMIGFPLRLLARENYDRAVKAKGEKRVALITGEEKIVPPEACWFLCTVESMPVDRRVAFLGVDEIQMCADPDRGHLFTDRLLHARGELETMFMGAETIRPLLRRLVPDAEFITRPRFSALTHAGPCKLSRLPPRSAVVAFSAADVYTIAELVRRQRGGAAIVLGALSPRTRNAQVAMYQAGEVDYLVATDAIGMGLNMHVDHVAFAATRKFDGRAPRPLSAAEMAQIAGRAGRYTKDGTFGTTAEIGTLDEELAQRIQSHQFDALTALQWRNAELSFVSLPALKSSLARLPERRGLVRAREADDERVLSHLAADEEIVRLARGPSAVALLWDVCRVPDFGKVESEAHARLLGQMYRYLAAEPAGGAATGAGRLPTDWVARHVDRLNRTDGDIEALMQRIAGIRTWTYVAHQGRWLEDVAGWQQRTRAIEDKLSDALHDRLIQRFVDRRTASLVGRMQSRHALQAAVGASGEVHVEGHFVGHLEGFRFAPDPAVRGGVHGGGDAGRSVTAAALRALGSSIRRRVDELEADADEQFALADDGCVRWRDALVGRLAAGAQVLAPRVEPLASDLLDGEARTRIQARLAEFVQRFVRRRLAPLFLARDALLTGPARGLVYQVTESLGSLARHRVAAQIAALSAEDRETLTRLGLRMGRDVVWFPRLLKPRTLALRALLWRVHTGTSPAHTRPAHTRPAHTRPTGTTTGGTAGASHGLLLPGAPSLPRHAGTPEGFWEATGYRLLGPRAVRIDSAERLAARAVALVRAGNPVAGSEFARLLGCPEAEVAPILAALGFRAESGDAGMMLSVGRRARRTGSGPRPAAGDGDGAHHSPFAALKVLRGGR